MGWSEVGGYTRFIKCAECACDDVLVEGKYLGKANNQYGEYHKFRSLGEEMIGLRGGHISYLLEEVNPGTVCKVVYRGIHILEEGPFRGKETHRFQLFISDQEVAPEPFDASKINFDEFGDL